MTWALLVVIVGLIGSFYLLKKLILAIQLIIKYLKDEGDKYLPEAINIFGIIYFMSQG